MADHPSLDALVSGRRILVCVGAGGVGKTTTAAALGLAGAGAGRRTLVLTIDPAKRLADALGIASLGHEIQRVPLDRIDPSAAARSGSLHAMMLDQKRAFDEIVERYTTDPEMRARIFHNRIYQQISSTLAGSHEYAAMAKLEEIARDPAWQLIVVDTPPTSNALDFLDAPETLTAAIDSPAIQWFTRPYREAGRFSLKAVSLGAAFVLKRLARFVGSAFLEDMAQFFVEFNAVLGGFRERAREVFDVLRQPDVAFVLVSSPEPLAVDEAIFFHQRLVSSHMPLGGFVVNRVHPVGPPAPPRELIIGKLTARPELRGYSPDDVVQVAADFDRSYQELRALGTMDARQIERLRQSSGGVVPLVPIPFFDRDVYDQETLSSMVRYLVGSGA